MPFYDLLDPRAVCVGIICFTALLPDNQQQTISPGSFRQVLRPVNHGKAKTKTKLKPKACSALPFYLLLENVFRM